MLNIALKIFIMFIIYVFTYYVIKLFGVVPAGTLMAVIPAIVAAVFGELLFKVVKFKR